MDRVDAGKTINLVLPTVAQLYGQKSPAADYTWSEATKLIIDKFPYLSINEIKEAYRQYFTGEIEAKGAEMYRGEFNVGSLGKILSAYSERRKKVLGTYLREKEEQKDREGQERKRRIMQDAFNREFPKMIEKSRTEITDWREVPAYWYDSANKRGMIKFEQGEAVQIFQDAQELERIERANEQDESMTLADVFRRQENNPLERAKVIARKLTVFRKLIKNPAK